ncbi:atp-dependent rna helicase dbp9 [Ceraceosorus bombacis]|uniref:RNA helicase n=1 Tax=Ceraceosorus bombacis TaxID=401625 RepID=A0A0P1BAX6_9BASI|nr:atp-dependent rna helicase dbp9 [Ceraceosorus bombacis]
MDNTSATILQSSSSLVAPQPQRTEQQTTFSSFAHVLDARILRALSKLGFAHPTTVQQRLIPLALSGKDLLAQAPTGSGKTLAYALPAVQRILSAKSAIPLTDPARQQTRCVVLVPTRELAEQVTRQIAHVLEYLDDETVAAVNAACEGGKGVHKLLLSTHPDIVISTPTRTLAHIETGALSLSSLQLLVLDEADLILSYGHAGDVKALLEHSTLPSRWQNILCSATLGPEVRQLMGAKLRKPVTLRLQPSLHLSHLAQYSVQLTSQADKFLLIFVILRLKLVRGKCIIFVNSTERAYRVRLFLEQFGIRSTVLNEELPVESRFHIVQQFNKGVYDYIVATDESRFGVDAATAHQEEQDLAREQSRASVEGSAEFEVEEEEAVPLGAERNSPKADTAASDERKRKRDEEGGSSRESKVAERSSKRRGGDAEYGVARGIDFVSVACVINFDLPVTARGYVHRIGRTARAGQTGTSLSFVVPSSVWKSESADGSASAGPLKKSGVSHATAAMDEGTWSRIEEDQRQKGTTIKEWNFDKPQIEGFRYRVDDAMRAVTRAAIKEARIKEIKQELLNSEKLKAHFEDNPHDLAYLRHDKSLHSTRVQPHLKHVPSYLMPRITRLKQPSGPSSASSDPTASGSSRPATDSEGRNIFVANVAG